MLIGITNAKYSSNSSSEASIDNIGFAIPMDDVIDMIEVEFMNFAVFNVADSFITCGAILLLCALLSLLWYRRMAMKEFGGVTGDTSGFFLQICELSMLAGVCLGGLVL